MDLTPSHHFNNHHHAKLPWDLTILFSVPGLQRAEPRCCSKISECLWETIMNYSQILFKDLQTPNWGILLRRGVLALLIILIAGSCMILLIVIDDNINRHELAALFQIITSSRTDDSSNQLIGFFVIGFMSAFNENAWNYSRSIFVCSAKLYYNENGEKYSSKRWQNHILLPS